MEALTYINQLSANSRKRISSVFEDEIEEICYLLSKQVSVLDNYLEQAGNLTNDKPYNVAFGIMYKSATSIMASLELTINGYKWEPITLLRNSLEGCASAWDIVHNPSQFELWKEDKFNSPKSITNLNKEFCSIGKMYGLLSNMYVHTSPLNASPSMYMNEGKAELQKYGYLPTGKEDIQKSEIYFVLLVSFVCLQLTEVTFWKYSDKLETIKLIPGRNAVQVNVSKRHRMFVDNSLAHFTRVVSGEIPGF